MTRKVKLRLSCSIIVLLSLLLLCACGTGTQSAPSPTDPPSSTLPAAPSSSPPAASAEPSLPSAPDTTESPLPESSVPEIPAVSPEPEQSPSVEAEQLERYFDNAVFVGDSIMEGIRQYVAGSRTEAPTLGNAQFLTSTMGVSVSRLLNEADYGPYFRYKGENQMLLQILDQMDCEKIFLLLGLNDLGRGEQSVEAIVKDYSTLINTLQNHVPEAEIIVIASPPKVASYWLPDYIPNKNYSNALILEFVTSLRSMCEARGTAFIDIHSLLKNENGALPDEYCRDGFIHLSNAGSAIVVEELYRFAADRIATEGI